MSVHKRETLHGTWKSESVSCSVMSDSATSWNVCSPPGFSVPGVLQARILKRFPFPLPGHFPNTGIKPQSPVLQADCLLSEPPGKPFLAHGLLPIANVYGRGVVIMQHIS